MRAGAGDGLSDLDLGIAARDPDWERIAEELPDRLRRFAPPVDLLSHSISEWGTRPHRRLFVQYADGRQIDVVTQPTASITGRVPGAIVLYDPDGRMAEERVVGIATPTTRALARVGGESESPMAAWVSERLG